MKRLVFSDQIEQIAGIAPAVRKALQAAGLSTVGDLLEIYPIRWEDFSQVKKISELSIGDQVSFVGEVVDIRKRKAFRRRGMMLTDMLLRDGSGAIVANWFRYFRGMSQIKVGDRVIVQGVIRMGKRGRSITHPNIESIGEGVAQGSIVPLYSSTYGLSSFKLQSVMQTVLASVSDIPDPIIPSHRIKRGLVGKYQALVSLHSPRTMQEVEQARSYFAYFELLTLQLKILEKKKELDGYSAPQITANIELLKQATEKLSYSLTGDQKKAIWTIAQDLAKSTPMNRLLEGDVGSGKTLVACMAMLLAVQSGYQAVLLAPTEILVAQHYETVKNFFQSYGIVVAQITAKKAACDLYPEDKTMRRNIIRGLLSGEVHICVGTHAVLSDKVIFNSLALAIVDEQHRFGVGQRKKIKNKQAEKDIKVIPHFLSLTATPIPRTLALALYGDLDISIIREKPEGRLPVTSRFVKNADREKAYDFIRHHLFSGSQAYLVCPVIEQGESAVQNQKKAVMDEYQKMMKVFPDITVSYIHGRMKKDEQQEVMDEFRSGHTQVLIATSIIEVGVDVPNATIMMIESADRFGLSQLHQLRGRVGRGTKQSFCFLFSDSQNDGAISRLEQFSQIHDGFSLSEFDLAERGPGEFWGVEQSGFPKLHFASLSDTYLMNIVREDAEEILQSGIMGQYPLLAKTVEQIEIINHNE